MLNAAEPQVLQDFPGSCILPVQHEASAEEAVTPGGRRKAAEIPVCCTVDVRCRRRGGTHISQGLAWQMIGTRAPPMTLSRGVNTKSFAPTTQAGRTPNLRPEA